MKSDYLVPNNEFNKNIDYAIGKYKVVFISATIGSGKTVAVQNWIRTYCGKYQELSFTDKESFLLLIKKMVATADHMLYIIPNLQRLYGDASCLELLADCIQNARGHCCFLITSRASMPVQLQRFIVTKQAKVFGKELLRFSIEMTTTYLNQCGIEVEYENKKEIHSLTKGYPLLLANLCSYLETGEKLNSELIYRVKTDFFAYLDKEVFQMLCEEDKLFMIKLSLIKQDARLFSNEVMCVAVGSKDISKQLSRLCAIGRFLMEKEPGKYRIINLFVQFLTARQTHYLSQAEIIVIYKRLGAYFEEKDDIYHSVYYYKQAGEIDKVADLLIYNIREKAVGAAQYYELAPYYMSLPENTILQSPALISGMSMLYSLLCDIEKSEKYFSLLEQMFKRCKKGTEEYSEICRYRMYLLISLPHSGTIKLAKYILDTAVTMKSNNYTLQPISVTGNMPSLMNGGKDFCNWARHDRLLYGVLAESIEHVLKRQGYGIPDIGMGESVYEKNLFNEAFLLLSSGIAKVEVGGTIELYFAGQGVFIRLLMAQGKWEEALRIIAGLEKRFINQNATHLIPNLHAFYVRIKMYMGKELEKSRWLTNDAPDEVVAFRISDRFLYLTKVRILISELRYQEAIVLLDKIYSYAFSYNRSYIVMETMLLKSIVLYRMQDEHYISLFSTVLKKAKSYGFIRIIADEGAAVWDLIKEWKPSDAYIKELKNAVEKQMLLYPDYLQMRKKENIVLSSYELSVLHFLENGMSNLDISEVMAISVHTVKYHLGNIYQKLDVKSRTMAIKAAREYELI